MLTPVCPGPTTYWIALADSSLVYDYINVATIHNSSIPHDNLLTPSTLYQLRTLADSS